MALTDPSALTFAQVRQLEERLTSGGVCACLWSCHGHGIYTCKLEIVRRWAEGLSPRLVDVTPREPKEE